MKTTTFSKPSHFVFTVSVVAAENLDLPTTLRVQVQVHNYQVQGASADGKPEPCSQWSRPDLQAPLICLPTNVPSDKLLLLLMWL